MAEEQLGTCVMVLTTDQAPFDRGLAQANAKADAAGKKMTRTMAGHMESASKSMGRVGSEMTRNVTLPVVGLGAAAVKMGADFQQAMEMVHTQSGATQKEVDNLKGKVLELAKTSPQGPTELANALYRLEGAGYRGAAAMKALKAASDLAMVGNANVEDTTKTLTQVMKPGIKGIKDFNDAVAQINATVGAGDMRLSALVDALGTGVVTSAKMAGLSFQDVTGALAVFGDETNNISGWAAQLATAFHFITNPTQKAQVALASIGLQGDSLAADMRKPNGLVRALRDLKDHLNETFPPGSGGALSIKAQRDAVAQYRVQLEQMGMSAGQVKTHVKDFNDQLKEGGSALLQQEQVLGDLFPGGRGRVLTVLLNQVDLLQQKEKQEKGTTKDFAESVAKAHQLLANKLKTAWSTIQVDLVQLGQAIGPDVVKAGSSLANDADKIASAFMRLPPGVRQAIITGGLITAAIGPSLKILSMVTGAAGKLTSASMIAARIAGGQGVGSFRSTTSVAAGGVSKAAADAETRAAAQVTTATQREATAATVATEQLELFGAALKEKSGQLSLLPFGEEKANSAVPLAPAATTAAETAPAVSAGFVSSVKSGLSKALGRGMQGAMIGTIGVGLSQIIGSSIHGAVGSAVKSIGTDASIGAGLGAMFGPEGMAGGAILGGLLGTFKHFFATEDYGQQVAGSVFSTKGLGGANAQSLQKQLASTLDQLRKAQTVTVAGKQVQLDISSLVGPQLVKAEALAQKAGNLIATKLEGGWNQYRIQSEPVMFTQLRSSMKKLPPEAQAAAIQSAVNFMRGLEKQGRVAKGSTDQFISDIMREFPKAVQQMGIQGAKSAQAFAKALDFKNAERDLKNTLGQVENHFSGVRDTVVHMSGSIEDKSSVAVKALLNISRHGTGPMKRQADADIKAMRASAVKDLNAMQGKVSTAATSMRKSLANGSGQALKDVGSNMDKLVGRVGSAMQSGLLLTDQGAQLIARALNNTLKAFGAKPLPVASAVQWGKWAAGKAPGSSYAADQPRGAATGAIFQIGRPGEAGRDTVPMSVGGQNIVVAPGEQVVVFNRHQIPEVNARFADQGGLPGFFAKHKKPNNFTSGGLVNPRGFAAGGTLSYGQLEGLWDRANPDLKQDDALMAAIAMAESGGRDVVNSIGATGYWQIHPGGAQYLDPMANARAAGEKLRTQGLSAWVTYVTGAYKAFLNGKVPADLSGLGGSAWTDMTPPGIKGTGTIASIARAAMKLATDAANKYGQAHSPAGAMSGTANLPSGGGFSPDQLGSFDGKQVAKWIIPELEWARQHGWAGQVTSGWRSPSEVVHGVFATAPQGQSEHRNDIYPGGAVDVSDYQQFASIIRGYPGRDKLIQLSIDPLHFSGTGHARGGLVGFAGGGLPSKSKTSGKMNAFIAKAKAKGKKKAAKPKKPKPLSSWQAVKNTIQGGKATTAGKTGPFPFDWADVAAGSPMDKILKAIYKLDGGDSAGVGVGTGGDAQKMWDKINWFTGSQWPAEPSPNFSSIASPADFVVSQDAQGNPIAPYINQDRLSAVVKELTQAIGWQAQGVTDLRSADQYSKALIPAINVAIRRRVDMVKRIRKRIQNNVKKINALKKKVNDAKKAIAAENKKHPPKGKDAAKAWQRAHQAKLKSLSKQIKGWEAQYKPLEAENQYLAGNKDSVGSGGELGTILGQLGSAGGTGAITLAEGGGDSASGLYALLSAVQGWDQSLGGMGGEIAQQQLTLNTWRGNLSTLASGAQDAQVAAQAQYAANQPAAAADTSALDALKDQLIASLTANQDVLGAQYSVLSGAIGNMPPFGGFFAEGGIVPGPLGAARTAIVHGGEQIVPVGGDMPAPNVHVHIDRKSDLNRLIDVRIAQNGRQTVGTVLRGNQGRAGRVMA